MTAWVEHGGCVTEGAGATRGSARDAPALRGYGRADRAVDSGISDSALYFHRSQSARALCPALSQYRPTTPDNPSAKPVTIVIATVLKYRPADLQSP